MPEFLALVLFKEVFIFMTICWINKAVVLKVFLENDVDLIEGFLDKIDLRGDYCKKDTADLQKDASPTT